MKEKQEWMDFSESDLKRFKKKYEKAVEANKCTFMFNGKEFYCAYARYVIEYLDSFN